MTFKPRYIQCYKYANINLRLGSTLTQYFVQFFSLFKLASEKFEPRTRQTHKATTFGIHRNSIFNTSRYFHVAEGLLPDVMHDVLEGSLPLEVKEMLKVFITTKVINLSNIQTAMTTFPYSGNDLKNKPILLAAKTLANNDHSLKQTGKCKCWVRCSVSNLISCLPTCSFTDVVFCKATTSNIRRQNYDPHWENFLNLLTITGTCVLKRLGRWYYICTTTLILQWWGFYNTALHQGVYVQFRHPWDLAKWRVLIITLCFLGYSKAYSFQVLVLERDHCISYCTLLHNCILCKPKTCH